MNERTSILAISSSVAKGHVGLSAIVPAAGGCGADVIALPTVILSNHPGFARCEGTRIAPETLTAMLDALDENGMLAGIHTILSGYLPTPEHVAVVERAIEQVRRRSPDAVYVCDPIMGDDPAGLYIDEEVAVAIRDRLVPRADVVLPNRYELAWLSEMPVDSVDDAIEAGRSLDVGRVIATSVPLPPDHLSVLEITPDEVVSFNVPRLEKVPKGTGDMLSGLIASGRPLQLAMSSLQAIIQRSLAQDHLDLVTHSSGAHPGFARSIGNGKSVTGVDGCPGGWIAVTFPIGEPEGATWHLFETAEALFAATAAHCSVAIDIPIGLADVATLGGRAADREARAVLGPRKSSVFSMPARAAVYAADYQEACDLAFAHSDPPRKISKQTYNLFPKIREVDALMTPALQQRVFECHPEVSFWALNGSEPLSEPKKSKSRAHEPGRELRRGLLEAAGFTREFLFGPDIPRKHVALDDFLDACAAAWSAARVAQGIAAKFPKQSASLDGSGLRMEIVY